MHSTIIKDLSELDVNRQISPHDVVLSKNKGTIESYYSIGFTGARTVAAAVFVGDMNAAEILDFGCNYGRVTRWLRAMFPDAAITGADVHREQVEFCSKEFGTIPMLFDGEYRNLSFDRKFDCIWLGSILTHLDIGDWEALLEKLYDQLTPRGILCFSVSGKYVHDSLKKNIDSMKKPDVIERYLKDYEESGFGFRFIRSSSGVRWGRSLISHDRLYEFVSTRGWRILFYGERLYGRRQDVCCVQRNGWGELNLPAVSRNER